MNDALLQETNERRIKECALFLRGKFRAILADMASHGYRARIQEAYRSPEAQANDYHKGTSKVSFGYHNITGSSGEMAACAIDIVDDDRPLNEEPKFFLILTASAYAHGLDTGIEWGTSDDNRQHIEALVANRQFDGTYEVGWDPYHVQPRNTSPARLQMALRKNLLPHTPENLVL